MCEATDLHAWSLCSIYMLRNSTKYPTNKYTITSKVKNKLYPYLTLLRFIKSLNELNLLVKTEIFPQKPVKMQVKI